MFRCMKACYARDTSPDTKLCAEKANKIVVRNPPRRALDSMEAKVVGTGFASPLSMEHAVPISELNQQLRSREKVCFGTCFVLARTDAGQILKFQPTALKNAAPVRRPCSLCFGSGQYALTF